MKQALDWGGGEEGGEAGAVKERIRDQDSVLDYCCMACGKSFQLFAVLFSSSICFVYLRYAETVLYVKGVYKN